MCISGPVGGVTRWHALETGAFRLRENRPSFGDPKLIKIWIFVVGIGVCVVAHTVVAGRPGVNVLR